MATFEEVKEPGGIVSWLGTNVARLLLALSIPVVAFVVMREGFFFLRDSDANGLVIALVLLSFMSLPIGW